MSVRRWQFHISHLTPLPESWLTGKAPVKPSLKLNEPYIIWGKLRPTLSHSELVWCFSQVKQCWWEGQRGRWHEPHSPFGRIEMVSLHNTVADWGGVGPGGLQGRGRLSGRRAERWIYTHQSGRQGARRQPRPTLGSGLMSFTRHRSDGIFPVPDHRVILLELRSHS